MRVAVNGQNVNTTHLENIWNLKLAKWSVAILVIRKALYIIVAILRHK
jgi:hypothetical protein